MSRSTISTFQLFAMFPDESTARVYLERNLWPKGTTCPTCGGQDRITTRKREGFYRCNKCQLDFTIRTGTIFERSHIPLHKWVYGMYLLVTARKGISSMQLAKEIGVTQKTAWFMLQRLREACMSGGGKDDRLAGLIEVDETFVGGKEANKHEAKKLRMGSGNVDLRREWPIPKSTPHGSTMTTKLPSRLPQRRRLGRKRLARNHKRTINREDVK